jgi:upstream activation factor subunit UAF30
LNFSQNAKTATSGRRQGLVAPNVKTMATKTAKAPNTTPKEAKKVNAAFSKLLTPSPELAAVIGATPVPRTEVVKGLWDYIKKHKLQDAGNKRVINADAKLAKVFGKPSVDMFEMTKLVGAHLKG